MKKIKRLLSALLVVSAVVTTPLYANAWNDKCIYTSSGFFVSVADASDDLRLTAIGSPGAMVEADCSLFNTILAHSSEISSENWYSCYGSSTGPETLTLGLERNANTNRWDEMSALQAIAAKQIQYIKNIGGIMTGYSFVDDGLNISWNVGGMHHFARFELEGHGKREIGYYDLMYNDSSNVDIKAMNDSFGVIFEDQF